VYIRRNIPRGLREAQRVLLFYENCENRCTMLLSEDIVEETEEMRYYGAKAPRSWFLVDQKRVDRFAHVGDTIVPGAGVRWKHVHRQSGSTLGPAAAAAAAVQPAAAASWFGGAAGGAQLATVAEDDTNELPWQVRTRAGPASARAGALAAARRFYPAPALALPTVSPPPLRRSLPSWTRTSCSSSLAARATTSTTATRPWQGAAAPCASPRSPP
jgi:hypothetical protein